MGRVILLLAMATLTTAAPIRPQQLPTPREAEEMMKRHRERARGTFTLGESLLEILRGAGVPGGLAQTLQCSEPTRHPRPSGASLRQMLDSLAAAEPQYGWQVEGGVVNFLPQKGVHPLLEVHVARFRAADVTSAGEALVALMETPEVRRAMSDPEVGSRLLRGRLGYYDPDRKAAAGKKFSVSLRDVTVREALNDIARADGRAMWSFRPVNCRGGNDFELEFVSW